MATLIRACRKYARRRHSLHRLAAPVAWSTPAVASTTKAILAKCHTKPRQRQLFDVRLVGGWGGGRRREGEEGGGEGEGERGGGRRGEGVGWVVRMINDTACLSRRVRAMQLIRVAEHLGASSRRPRHPFPALMAGEPWPCTCVHGPKKPSRHTMSCNWREIRSFLYVWTP